MITNDFTQGVIQFYMDQYTSTTNQIQLIMNKQDDLTKLIRELNDYQLLLVSRQNDLLRSLNDCVQINNRRAELISETTNQPVTQEEPSSDNDLSERLNAVTFENTRVPRGYYPNLDPLPSYRQSRRNTSSPTTATTATSTRTTSTTASTASSPPFDNYLIYSFLPERTSRTSRNSQTPTSPNLASSLIETFIDEFLNPVITAPTQEQIEQGTTLTIYRDIQQPVNTSCPISLNLFQPDDVILQIDRCRHNYSPPLLREWFRTNNHCPLCRIDIR